MKLTIASVMALAASAVASNDFVKRGSYSSHSKGPTDVQILNYALTLEYLEADFYRGALAQFSDQDFADAGFAPYVRQRVVEIGSDEAIHVSVLAGALGKAAVQPCTYKFPYTDVASFLSLSSVLEGVGVSAYLGAAPDITSDAYLAVAGSIVTVEARHNAEINVFQGQDGSPSPFDTPLDYSQVYTLAAPFITSCPKGNAAKLPSPLVAFPALTFTGTAEPGQTIKLAFKPRKGCKAVYAHFLNGINDFVVKVNNSGNVKVPQVAGRTYIVVTDSKTLSDKSTIAGPAFFEVSTPNIVA